MKILIALLAVFFVLPFAEPTVYSYGPITTIWEDPGHEMGAGFQVPGRTRGECEWRFVNMSYVPDAKEGGHAGKKCRTSRTGIRISCYNEETEHIPPRGATDYFIENVGQSYVHINPSLDDYFKCESGDAKAVTVLATNLNNSTGGNDCRVSWQKLWIFVETKDSTLC